MATLSSPAQFNIAVMTDGGGNLVNGFTVGGTNRISISGSTNISLATNAMPWSAVSKAGVSLAELPARNFVDLQNTPSTLDGYGITNAATGASVSAIVGSATSVLGSLNASNPAIGTVPDARLAASVTRQGRAFNSAGQLVQLGANAALPATTFEGMAGMRPPRIITASPYWLFMV
ncbi:MAG: hypothetical protein LBK60_00680 [Verrucomicrobiales bacterium]|jgi:hypothetical protein|nr:hypothetical protein [Verrucomicrobiales bacterium]